MSDMYTLRNKLFKRSNTRAGLSTMFMGLFWASGGTAILMAAVFMGFAFFNIFPQDPTTMLIPLIFSLVAWGSRRLQLWFRQLSQDDDRRVSELDFQIYRPKGTVAL